MGLGRIITDLAARAFGRTPTVTVESIEKRRAQLAARRARAVAKHEDRAEVDRDLKSATHESLAASLGWR
jgi:hypothetical protein